MAMDLDQKLMIALQDYMQTQLPDLKLNIYKIHPETFQLDINDKKFGYIENFFYEKGTFSIAGNRASGTKDKMWTINMDTLRKDPRKEKNLQRFIAAVRELYPAHSNSQLWTAIFKLTDLMERKIDNK